MKLAPQVDDGSFETDPAAEPDRAEQRSDGACSTSDPERPAIVLSNAIPPAPRPITLDTIARPATNDDAAAARRPPAPLAADVSPIPDGVVFDGEALRRAREARGLTVEQVCERTRITRQHVENVEADRYELLPPAVYLRGILLSLAKQLRLDGQKVARSYMEASAADRAKAR